MRPHGQLYFLNSVLGLLSGASPGAAWDWIPTPAVHVSRNDRRQGFPRWCRGSLGTGAVTRGLVEPGRVCAAKFSGSPTGRLEEAEVAEAMNRAPAVYRGLPAHALLEELQLPD